MFMTRLVVVEGAGESWVLQEPLVWDDGRRRFEVPAGFVTDLDSVPRLPVVWLLLKGWSRGAAVLHDWLYSEGLVSRAEADRVFLDAMRATGVGVQRFVIWAGVRLFGRLYFRQMREDRA
jgi:hypothetical protein